MNVLPLPPPPPTPQLAPRLSDDGKGPSSSVAPRAGQKQNILLSVANKAPGTEGQQQANDSSSSYESGFPTGDHEFFTTFSWDDQKVRRVFIRKVTTSPSSPRLGG
ncbi:FAIM2 [Cervus elaphus hippelaphus]|uniref:FAIM2 n=1 Tax=Cervus elaphus hippelaphus TaxID=46360 RepID=A0A212DFR5_CEREH|nr:FAIM2 [Cervus elaphus hippelaphus]